jgi:hypothetical protein
LGEEEREERELTERNPQLGVREIDREERRS